MCKFLLFFIKTLILFHIFGSSNSTTWKDEIFDPKDVKQLYALNWSLSRLSKYTNQRGEHKLIRVEDMKTNFDESGMHFKFLALVSTPKKVLNILDNILK